MGSSRPRLNIISVWTLCSKRPPRSFVSSWNIPPRCSILSPTVTMMGVKRPRRLMPKARRQVDNHFTSMNPPQRVRLGIEDGPLEVDRLLGSEEQVEILEGLGQEIARHEVP